jgi:hypothetical protein
MCVDITQHTEGLSEQKTGGENLLSLFKLRQISAFSWPWTLVILVLRLWILNDITTFHGSPACRQLVPSETF